MRIKGLEDLTSDNLIEEALRSENIEKLIRGARIRRNIYLWLFCISFFCILVGALTSLPTFAVVALFLTTLSLVVITKYDVHLVFLRIIHKQQIKKAEQEAQQDS